MKIVLVIGWCLIVFAVVGAFAEFSENSHSSPRRGDRGRSEQKDHTAGIVLVVLFGGAGIALVRAAGKPSSSKSAQMSSRDIEDVILGYVRKRGGRVTATDVAADTPVTFAEAKAGLETLAKAGACRSEPDGNSLTTFIFDELLKKDA